MPAESPRLRPGPAPAQSWLAQARDAVGLTQAQLADRLGVTQGAIHHWERQLRPVPHQHRGPLCEALGIPRAALEVWHGELPAAACHAGRRHPVELAEAIERAALALREER